MRVGNQFQEYINGLIEAGSLVEELIDIPRDYPDLIKAGNDYRDLMSRPGWQRLLDDLELRANRCLANLRGCESNDATVVKGLRDRWREAEDSLKFVQIHAQEAVDRRAAVIADVGAKAAGLGLDLDLENKADEHVIREWMKQDKDSKPSTIDDLEEYEHE